MKLYKIMFMNSLIIGTLISISAYSWMSMWMGLEINLLSIIPLMSKKSNSMSTEASMKYFITQSMASMILLMAILLLLTKEEFINPLMNSSSKMMMNSALMIKMGAAPFHFWFPEVMEGLNWPNSIILLTWQKIAPMMILMNNNIEMMFITMIILVSLMTSTINSFYQMSIRKIMAYSSINHIAWMLTAMMISFPLWMCYFLVYCIINIAIILNLNSNKTFYLNQINISMNEKKQTKLFLSMNFLSLGGLPPFIGFIPKWLVIKSTSFSSMEMITFTLIVTTLIMLFIYIRMMITITILTTNEQKIQIKKKNSIKMMMINSITIMSMPLCTLIPSMI